MNAYGRKGHERKRPYTITCGKERKNRPQMPVAKKERTDHKCLWQRKTKPQMLVANEKWLP